MLPGGITLPGKGQGKSERDILEPTKNTKRPRRKQEEHQHQHEDEGDEDDAREPGEIARRELEAGLGVLTLVHAVTPWTLLLFTLVLGVGAVLNDPAWQRGKRCHVAEHNIDGQHAAQAIQAFQALHAANLTRLD